MILFFDSNVLIYLIEGDAILSARVQQTVQTLYNTCADVSIAVSALALLECRVAPLRDNNTAVLRRYDEFFSTESLQIVDLSRTVLDSATRIRASFGLKTPDAIQAACCLSLEFEHLFLTEDRAFSKVEPLHVYNVLTPR
ncbi:MAG: type II toxin-antitoxin system VapC family toxin [Chlorobiaceae bacterium]|nr:type II toxin-antitoxin system VapC family toxin [Chlorobiaceae bacterium]